MPKAYKFWDRSAKRYAKSPVADEAAYQTKLAMTRAYLKPDMTVFEFGCGTGSTAIAHAPLVKSIKAIDFSKKMVAIAQLKALDAEALNVDFMNYSIAGFPLDDPSFDVVMAHNILHLLPDWKAAISKAFDLLHPGGYFISSTYCLGGQKKLLQLLLPVGAFLGLTPTVSFFSDKDLEQAIKNAGFKVLERWQPGEKPVLFLIAQKPH